MSDTQFYGDAESVIAQSGLTPEMLEGIADQPALVAFVESELTEATDEINRFCNRAFYEPKSHTDTREGNGTPTIQLQHYPVTDVVSVEREGRALVEGEDFELLDRRNFSAPDRSENKGILKRLGRRKRWRRHAQYTVEYSAGYESPPPTVRGVAENLVIAGMREAIVSNATAENGGTQSVSMDGFSATYDVPSAVQSGDITEESHNRLKGLRQLGVGSPGVSGW